MCTALLYLTEGRTLLDFNMIETRFRWLEPHCRPCAAASAKLAIMVGAAYTIICIYTKVVGECTMAITELFRAFLFYKLFNKNVYRTNIL